MADHADPEIRQRTADNPMAAGDHAVMPDAFISYASHDSAVATALVEALERTGVRCWIAPRDVKAGALYADAIVRAISGARAFILVLSENSIDSSHVSKEIERASSKKRPIIALRIDAAPLTPALEYFLSESQWVEPKAGNMQAAYAKLIDAIRGLPPTTAGAAPAVHRAISAAPAPLGQPKSRFIQIIVAAAIAIVVGYLVADKYWESKRSAAQQSSVAVTPTVAPVAPANSAGMTISENSIAVLPFSDMSEKKDQEYFSDGLSEELIDLLTKIPDLHVPARTSSFYFKGKSEDIQTIAHKLLVAHVLEGSVRRSGNHLRVTAQLVRADNGYHLWSETYDRNVDDIFKVQDDIAGAVVKALKVSLLKTEAPRAAPTANSEAYRLYLQAVSLARRESTDDTAQAYAYLRQALKLDPQFALAWAALAENYTDDTVDWDTVFSSANALEARTGSGNSQAASTTDVGSKLPPPGTTWQSVAKIVVTGSHYAVDRALRLGPNLPETHMAAARVRLYVDWDWAAAEREINKARELDPRNARVTQLAASWAITVGRLQQAIDLARLAATQDPLGTANFELGKASHRIGKLGDAENAYRQLLALYPSSTGFHYRYGLVLLELGRPEAALDEFNRDIPPYRQAGLPLALDALGRRADADRELALAEKQWGFGMGYQISYVYASRNNAERTMYWLERAYEQHDDGLLSMLHDPSFRNIEHDPRFAALLRKMNLQE
jgi:TolB-like protein